MMTEQDEALERASVCGFTTMDTTVAQDIALAAEFGLGGVGICETKLTDVDVVVLQQQLRDAGLHTTACIPANVSPLRPRPEGLYPGPADPDERTELMIDSLRRLAVLRPETVVFCTGSNADRDPKEAERIAAGSLRAVAAEAAALDLSISIEPIRDIGFDGSWLRSLPQVFDFLDLVGADNVYVCFDVYHLWDSVDVLRLLKANATRVGAVQVSDWHEPPRARADRLIPGEGSIDLAAIIGALEGGGYDGSYDIEIFSDDGRWGSAVPNSVWAMDPTEVFRRCVAGFRDAWARQA